MSPVARAAGARAHRAGALAFPPLRAVLMAGALCSGTAVLLAACSSSPRALSASNGGAAAPGRAAAPSAAGLPKSASAGSASAAGRRTVVLSAQSIIYTGKLTLRVKDVTTTAATATGIAIGAGGYVAGEQEVIPHHSNGTPLVTLVLKIPVAAYHKTLAKLAGLGSQISSSQHAQDVTQQVADVGSRVASAKAAISQLRALLGKAGTVGELLRVQEEINSQESQLEALIAQQQALLHETSYGTVTVTLLGHQVTIVKKKKEKPAAGFGAGLRAGWHALVIFVRWLLAALGAVLPFAIPAALLAGIVFELRRRLARRRTPPSAGPPAAAES